MKKHRKRSVNSRRLTAIVIVAVSTVALGAVTAISRQAMNPKNVDQPQVAKGKNKNYVTVKVAGQDVHVDSQTGKIKPLTPQEAEKLAKGLKEMLDQSTEGLVQVHHADGSVSMDLQDRFQNVTVARIDEGGTVSTSCVDNAQAAAAFFGINPELLEDRSNGGKPARQASSSKPNQ